MPPAGSASGSAPSAASRPLIFISHKHTDRAIANVIRGFMSEQSAGRIRVYQSSDAQAEGPRGGEQLNQELTEALWESQIVVLVYTTPDKDWGYCMWECGVAMNPASPHTRVIVFQCAEKVPDIFAGRVHVNARKAADVTRFVVDFMTTTDFLPRVIEPITGFDPTGPEVRRAADKLFNDLQAVLPEGDVSDTPVHAYLQLQVPLVAIKKAGEAEPKDATPATRAVLLNDGVVTDCDRGAASLFGMAELQAYTRLERVYAEWRRASPRESDAWLDSLADQVSRAAQSQLPLLKWAPMQSVETQQYHAPVVLRARRVPPAAAMQFDVHFLPWRAAGRSRASDVDRALFQQLFGEGVATDGLTAVFPTAMTSAPGRAGTLAGNTDPGIGLFYPNPPAEARGANPTGIEYVVPVEDLGASAQLAEMCQRSEVPFRTQLDSFYWNRNELLPSRTLVALGLGFNHVTTRLSRMTSLFSLVYPEGTDDFLIGGRPHGFPADGYDCALIARIVLEHATGFVPHFVCGGRTAAGTLAAGFFLARSWKKLIGAYQTANVDLRTGCAVVIIRFRPDAVDNAEMHGEPAFATST